MSFFSVKESDSLVGARAVQVPPAPQWRAAGMEQSFDRIIQGCFKKATSFGQTENGILLPSLSLKQGRKGVISSGCDRRVPAWLKNHFWR